jgi:hypothetical protein
MSHQPVLFPYLVLQPGLGPAGMAPMLPILLSANGVQVSAHGLVDSGAAVSVIPHFVGVQLGFDWSQQTITMPLTGTLAAVPARLVVLDLTVPGFTPVQMGFAWANIDTVPLLLGQMTFFHEFDVYFFRRRGLFQIELAQGP